MLSRKASRLVEVRVHACLRLSRFRFILELREVLSGGCLDLVQNEKAR